MSASNRVCPTHSALKCSFSGCHASLVAPATVVDLLHQALGLRLKDLAASNTARCFLRNRGQGCAPSSPFPEEIAYSQPDGYFPVDLDGRPLAY
jgi:hypothetical protein